jgi:hypothetical protein
LGGLRSRPYLKISDAVPFYTDELPKRPHVAQHGRQTAPLTYWCQAPGAILQSRGSLDAEACPRSFDEIGALMRSKPLVKDSVSPVSAVYPLHVQRQIDRRWFQRLEQTASVRMRLKAMLDIFERGGRSPSRRRTTPVVDVASTRCAGFDTPPITRRARDWSAKCNRLPA